MSDTTTTTAPITRTLDGQEVPAAGIYDLDQSHSSVAFSVRHLMVSKTRGRFGSFSGSITIGDDPTESSVDVTIDAASIDTADEKRDGHLRSPDFLDVEKYPTLTYKGHGVRPAKDGRWILDGELTVHGVTQPVPLEVTFEGGAVDPWGGARLGFVARTELDREAFGVTWNQALETGGVVVGKKVAIEIEAEAVRRV